jgi:hypothetical protein
MSIFQTLFQRRPRWHATRIRIRDSLARTLPAIVLLVMNAFVLGVAVTQS